MRDIFKEIGREIALPFPRMPYAEAIAKYGSDKPDLRFGLEIVDLSDEFQDAEFRVFKQIVAEGGVVRGFVVPGGGKYSGTQLRALDEQARQLGLAGLIWIRPGEPPHLGGQVAQPRRRSMRRSRAPAPGKTTCC